MSLSYKIVENIFYFLNRNMNNLVKRKISPMFSKPDVSLELPRSFYRNFCVKRIEYRKYPVYILRNKSKDISDKAILFLHGGGGMARPTSLHFDTVKRLLKKTNSTLFFAYYPLAPQHNATYALDWLEKIYMEICKKFKRENITFIGDSAGANLSIGLANRVDNKPGKIVAISLAAGLENGRNREIRKSMESVDPILSVEMNDLIALEWGKGMSLSSPDISPDYVSFQGFPKLLFIYGSHELFYPHVITLMKRLKREKIPYKRIEKPMCHDWALCSFFPEGRKVMTDIVKFVLADITERNIIF